MIRIDFEAEEIGDYGNITGDGLGNLLGAPKLEPLELLIREAVQNSWDARATDAQNIEFGVEHKGLQGQELRSIKKRILHSHPPELDTLVNRSKLPVLFVWDRGTRGLAGPVRPTETAGGPRDFVNFVYMIGETKPTKDHTNTVSGGSYGYGRSSFFRASRARTIFVHSRTMVGGSPESRFIGIAWLDKYTGDGGRQFTGRHWWGRRRGDWVGPLIGEEADDVARELGMPIATRRETGTTIMILDPAITSTQADDTENNDHDGPAAAQDQIISSILWNCWPRMLAGGIDFHVRWNGQNIQVPNPRKHPRLRAFAKAFDAVRQKRKDSQMASRYSIEILRPHRELGTLGMARRAFARGLSRPDPSCPVSPDEPLRHIALHTCSV